MHNTKGDVSLLNISRETIFAPMILCSIQNKINVFHFYSTSGMFLACS